MDALLFTDKETFQRERPTSPTSQQLSDFYRRFAKDIIDGGYSNDDIQDIIEDLQEDRLDTSSGYEMAKDLENYGGADYDINSDFISLLEEFDWRKKKLIEELEALWVKAHEISPKFQKGTRLRVNKSLTYTIKEGAEVYVNGIKDDIGKYLVYENPGYRGGYVLNYETVEGCCSIIE